GSSIVMAQSVTLSTRSCSNSPSLATSGATIRGVVTEACLPFAMSCPPKATVDSSVRSVGQARLRNASNEHLRCCSRTCGALQRASKFCCAALSRYDAQHEHTTAAHALGACPHSSCHHHIAPGQIPQGGGGSLAIRGLRGLPQLRRRRHAL